MNYNQQKYATLCANKTIDGLAALWNCKCELPKIGWLNNLEIYYDDSSNTIVLGKCLVETLIGENKGTQRILFTNLICHEMMHFVQKQKEPKFFTDEKKGRELQADEFAAYFVAPLLFKLSDDGWNHISRKFFDNPHSDYPSAFGRLVAIVKGMQQYSMRNGNDIIVSECSRDELFRDVKKEALSTLELDEGPTVAMILDWVIVSRETLGMPPIVTIKRN